MNGGKIHSMIKRRLKQLVLTATCTLVVFASCKYSYAVKAAETDTEIEAPDDVESPHKENAVYNPNDGHYTFYFAGANGWYPAGDKMTWWEKGYKMGCDYEDPNYRGKEIYDPASDAWYWLDNVQEGAMATSKDVFQESKADDEGHIGKWVRYDANGHMVKGWDTNDKGTYYFDLTYGTMYKGTHEINGKIYVFDTITGILVSESDAVIATSPDGHKTYYVEGYDMCWEKDVNGNNMYWYEKGYRQGVDLDNPKYRGKEIYDPATGAWYWLDNVNEGKMAVSKDVYQESEAGTCGDIEGADGKTYGKWVRYDANGYMVKGWDSANGGFYYFDPIYGTMSKGTVTIDGKTCTFNRDTGKMTSCDPRNADLSKSGIEEAADGLYAVSNGERVLDYTGLWNDQAKGWYYVTNGKVDTSSSQLIELGAYSYCIVNGKLDLNYNGLLYGYTGGGCPLIKNGHIATDYNGLYYSEDYKVNWLIKDGFIWFEYNDWYMDNTQGKQIYIKGGAYSEWYTNNILDMNAAKSYPNTYVYEDDNTKIYIENVVYDNCSFWVARVFSEDPNDMGSVIANGGVAQGKQKVVDMANSVNAIFAINGSGFYNGDSSGTPWPADIPVIKNGICLRLGTNQTSNMLGIFRDGSLKPVPDWKSVDDIINNYGLKDSFAFGPALIDDNGLNNDVYGTAYKDTEKYYRCAAGMVRKGYYIFIVTDFNPNVTTGMTLATLRDLMNAYGCKYAYQLDMGGSAQMYFQGKIINKPAWNEERAIIDILYFK